MEVIAPASIYLGLMCFSSAMGIRNSFKQYSAIKFCFDQNISYNKYKNVLPIIEETGKLFLQDHVFDPQYKLKICQNSILIKEMSNSIFVLSLAGMLFLAYGAYRFCLYTPPVPPAFGLLPPIPTVDPFFRVGQEPLLYNRGRVGC